MLAISQPNHNARPTLLVWLTPARDYALRVTMALVFLAGFGAALAVFAPPPAAPAVRIALPPQLPDPAALIPYLPETARIANAAIPIEPPSIAAPPFQLDSLDPAIQSRALDCLAAAAWYEAGDDPPGERAVAQVVLNRARHPAFPGSVCGVVFQGSERATGCQFSFTCDGSMEARRPGTAAWARARAVASAALTGAVDPRVGLATHYHADYVVPLWRNGLVKLAQVGLHLFYCWPGTWRTQGALRRTAGGLEPSIAAMAALSPAHRAAADNDVRGGRAGVLAYLPLDVAAATMQPTADNPAPVSVPAPNLSRAVGSADSQTDQIVLRLDPAAFPGTYAMRALAACADRARCTVLGELIGADSAQGPDFVYLRDRRSGGEGAWWNCDTISRANPARCLPKGGALARLLAQWH